MVTSVEMITAAAARNIAETSDAATDKFLIQTLNTPIRDAAGKGNNSYFHFLGAVEVWDMKGVTPTAFQVQVMDKLKALGFHVEFERNYGEAYVPPARQNDDGSGPLFKNFGFKISW